MEKTVLKNLKKSGNGLNDCLENAKQHAFANFTEVCRSRKRKKEDVRR
jgi:hypothetical protein